MLVVNDVVAGYIAAHEDAGKLNENVQSKWLPQVNWLIFIWIVFSSYLYLFPVNKRLNFV